jgi:hypothetical protein
VNGWIRRPPTGSPGLLADAFRGHEPAEALSTHDREHLVTELVEAGWTDLQIACHTRTTLYTTARIRSRLGLRRNRGGDDR